MSASKCQQMTTVVIIGEVILVVIRSLITIEYGDLTLPICLKCFPMNIYNFLFYMLNKSNSYSVNLRAVLYIVLIVKLLFLCTLCLAFVHIMESAVKCTLPSNFFYREQVPNGSICPLFLEEGIKPEGKNLTGNSSFLLLIVNH